MTLTLLTAAAVGAALSHTLYLLLKIQIKKKRKSRKVYRSISPTTDNGVEGNQNSSTQAGGNINQTLLPMNVDRHMERLYCEIDKRDNYIIDMRDTIDIQSVKIYALEKELSDRRMILLSLPCLEDQPRESLEDLPLFKKITA